MEEHQRRLVTAVLAIILTVVALVGWRSLRGEPESVVVSVATPRQVTLPAPDAGVMPGERMAAAGADAAAGAPARIGTPAATGSGTAAPAARSPEPETAGGSAAGRSLRVHVVGAVRRAGVYALPSGARVIDAVEQAGGARPDADLEAINLADFAQDGEQIHVPSRRAARASDRGIPLRTASGKPAATRPASRPSPSAGALPTRTVGRYPIAASAAPEAPARAAATGAGIVNVNTATAEELDTLPGVGPATAAAILEYRREHGPFQHPEDLLNVRGIGEKKLAAMRNRITVR